MMKKILLRNGLITLFFLFQTMVVHAAVTAWKIVPENSEITFTATQNNSPVSGQFKSFSGEINFDPAQLNLSHVQFIIDLNSVTASYGEVGSTLKMPNWFNVNMFPQAIYKSSSFTQLSDKNYQVQGVLTLKGKTLPVILTFVLEEYSADKARVKGVAHLKRLLFGVGTGEWANTDTVKDDVQVNFVINAVKK